MPWPESCLGEGGACQSWLVVGVRAWTIPYSLKFVEPLTYPAKAYQQPSVGIAGQGRLRHRLSPYLIQGYLFCLKPVKEGCLRLHRHTPKLASNRRHWPMPMVRLPGRPRLMASGAGQADRTGVDPRVDSCSWRAARSTTPIAASQRLMEACWRHTHWYCGHANVARTQEYGGQHTRAMDFSARWMGDVPRVDGAFAHAPPMRGRFAAWASWPAAR